MKYRKCIIASLTVALCVLIAAVLLLRAMNKFDYGEHVPHVSWLPPTATDVSYYRSFRWRAWEFNIDEAGFIAWAKENKWPVREVNGGDLYVTRYIKSLQNVRVTFGRSQRFEDEDHHWGNGWYCSEDGGELIVGFDRDIGRAYFLGSN